MITKLRPLECGSTEEQGEFQGHKRRYAKKKYYFVETNKKNNNKKPQQLDSYKQNGPQEETLYYNENCTTGKRAREGHKETGWIQPGRVHYENKMKSKSGSTASKFLRKTAHDDNGSLDFGQTHFRFSIFSIVWRLIAPLLCRFTIILVSCTWHQQLLSSFTGHQRLFIITFYWQRFHPNHRHYFIVCVEDFCLAGLAENINNGKPCPLCVPVTVGIARPVLLNVSSLSPSFSNQAAPPPPILPIYCEHSIFHFKRKICFRTSSMRKENYSPIPHIVFSPES